jgi:hypothetical protein
MGNVRELERGSGCMGRKRKPAWTVDIPLRMSSMQGRTGIQEHEDMTIDIGFVHEKQQ